jgi:predicted Fe-Mo cluster-binding NifX family protein
MRVIVPVLERNDENSRISQHFGRAPYLAVVEVLEGKINSLKFVNGEGSHEENRNEDEKMKASSIHKTILDLNPDAIVAMRIGPRAVEDFVKAGIKILNIEGNTLSDVVSRILSNNS